MTRNEGGYPGQGDHEEADDLLNRDPVRTKILVFLLIIIVFIASFEYKGYLLSNLEGYRLPDADGAFWTEAAFHFRHARMVKDGMGLPSLDKQIQYPEGIEVWKYCTPLMDLVYGNVFRLGLHFGLLFHQFVLKAQTFWCTLSVFAVFLGGLVLWRNSWGALLASAFYAFSLGHMDRTTIYLRENFALPLVWLHLAFFLMAVRTPKKGRNIWFSILSALLLILAFASWHVVRFYFLVFIIGIVLTQLPLRGERALGSRSLRNLRNTLLIITIANVIASLALPVLRGTWFIIDPSMALSYGLLICLSFLPLSVRLKGRLYYLLSLTLLILLFIVSSLIQRGAGLYSHVTELLMAKLRFMNVLPGNPNLLSYEAREMWNGPFMSPSFSYFVLLAIPGLALLCIVSFVMVKDWLKGNANRLAVLMVFLAFFFMFYFVLVMRFHVFMHVPIALLAARLGFGPAKKFRILGRVVLALFIVLQIFLLVSSRITVLQPSAQVLRSLTSFLKNDTPKEAVFACEFNLGPTIACDADRAVLLQSKFENLTIRKKIQDVYQAIFASEDDLISICRKYEATHFVLSATTILDISKESMRYLNGKMSIDQDMVAYQMHFDENRLHHFKLIFQNTNYRVFQISDEPVRPLPPDEYWPIWDASMMGVAGLRTPIVPDVTLKEALMKGMNPFFWVQCSEQLRGMGHTKEADSLVVRSISPALDALYKSLPFRPPNLPSMAETVALGAEEAAQLMLRQNQHQDAARILYRAAGPFALMKNFQRAMQLLNEAIECDPVNQQVIAAREQLRKYGAAQSP